MREKKMKRKKEKKKRKKERKTWLYHLISYDTLFILGTTLRLEEYCSWKTDAVSLFHLVRFSSSSNTACILNKRSCLFSLPTVATKVTLSPTPGHPKHVTQCCFESAISWVNVLSSFQTTLRACPYRFWKKYYGNCETLINSKQPAVTSIKKPYALGLLLLKLKWTIDMNQVVYYCEPCLCSNLNLSVNFFQHNRIFVCDININISATNKAKNNLAKFLAKNGFKALSVAPLTRNIKIHFHFHTVVCSCHSKRLISITVHWCLCLKGKNFALSWRWPLFRRTSFTSRTEECWQIRNSRRLEAGSLKLALACVRDSDYVTLITWVNSSS